MIFEISLGVRWIQKAMDSRLGY